ncbi:hypothetical protein [Solemya velum gill symbiont]|nr:hypothetical protein [Solemya velum gill symbiont]
MSNMASKRKRSSYDAAFKLKAVEFAEEKTCQGLAKAKRGTVGNAKN